MKTRLIALIMVLSIFVLGVSSSSLAQKAPKKTHHKTMMMDSTKVKTHKMKSKKTMMMDSTKTKTHKMKSTKTTTHHKMSKTSKSSMKAKKDTTGTK